MKCSEAEKDIDLLLDDEANELQTRELKAHLAICKACQSQLQLRQQTQILLKNQPPILPTNSFDKQMIQAFENTLQTKQKRERNWLKSLFLIPKPAFAFAVLLSVFGLATAFLLGRMSAASLPQIIVSEIEKTPEKIIVTVTPTPEIKEVVVTKTQEKVVTKYVNVPVVKEKTVEKIVYVEKPKMIFKEGKKEVQVEARNEKNGEDIAKQFNLKDLQPVTNVSYKIIRKGEDNEK